MRSIRVRGVAEKWEYPAICPNCHGTIVDGTVPLIREGGAPGYVTISFAHNWPHCSECVSFYTQRNKLRRQRNVRAIVWIVITAFVSSTITIVLMGALKWTLWVWPIVWLVLVVPALLRVQARFNRELRGVPSTRKRTTQGMAVTLIRCGRSAFSSKYVLDVRFASPLYAKEYISANAAAAKLKYRKSVLEAGLQEAELESFRLEDSASPDGS